MDLLSLRAILPSLRSWVTDGSACLLIVEACAFNKSSFQLRHIPGGALTPNKNNIKCLFHTTIDEFGVYTEKWNIKKFKVYIINKDIYNLWWHLQLMKISTIIKNIYN